MAIPDFRNTAKEFCSFVELHTVIRKQDLPMWLICLLDLYKAALTLSYPDCVDDEEAEDGKTIVLAGEYPCYYWEVFNPIAEDTAVMGTLTDDIQDIYHEITQGLQMVESQALWHWKFGFDNHWGNHAVDAIRAIHYMMNA